MTNKQLRGLLEKIDACGEAVSWVRRRNLTTAWAECERADWMLWFAGLMAGEKSWSPRKEVILAAIECGRLSLANAGKYRKQLEEVFAIAERCANNPTKENIAAARSAASSAERASCATWSSAESAAWSAESAAGSAWSAAWSAESAARSASSSAESSASSAACSAACAACAGRSAAAGSAIHRKMCDIIRKRLTIPKR